MKHLVVLLFISLAGIIACKDKKQNTVLNAETSAPGTAGDSAAIRGVILDFYGWYTKNYAKFQAYDLYSSLKKNNAAPYQINWEEVDKYQAFIRDSVPQLGEEFIINQKILFTKADSAFKVDTKDDVPYYFDYDWYTNSQEDPAYLLDGISKSTKWVISLKGDEAAVEIGAPEDKNFVPGSLLLYVGMKKEKGQWTIARIGND